MMTKKLLVVFLAVVMLLLQVPVSVFAANANYTVRFDGNGAASGTMEDQKFIYDEEQALTANAYKKPGYTFIEWNTEQDGIGRAFADGATVKNLTHIDGRTVTLYAIWAPNSYKVAFNGNGADEGEGFIVYENFIYDEEKALTPNVFTRTGYTFSEWNTEADGSGTKYKDRETVINLTEKDGDEVILYAIWDPVEHKIEYRPEQTTDNVPEDTTQKVYYDDLVRVRLYGGTWTAPDSLEKDEKENDVYIVKADVKLGIPTAVPKGKMFLGWRYTFEGMNTFSAILEDDENGNNVPDRYEGSSTFNVLHGTWSDGTAKSITAFATLYAEDEKTWSEGGTGFLDAEQVPTGMIPAAGYRNEGSWYSFDWKVTEEDITADEVTAESGSRYEYRFAPVDYEVEFDGNGANGGSMENEAFFFDEGKALTANAYTKTGYTFEGWDTQSEGKTVVYKDGEEVENLTDKDGGKVTLYAVWKANTYEVVFDGNGAEWGGMDNETFTYDVPQALDSGFYKYLKTGMHVIGWDTDSAGKTVVYKDEEEVINLTDEDGGKVTLYAVWDINSYEVAFVGPAGRMGMENEKFIYGEEKALTKNTYTEKGMHFVGWSDTWYDLKTVAYEDGAVVKNLSDRHGETVYLYSVWEENPYTVSWQPVKKYELTPDDKITDVIYYTDIYVRAGIGTWDMPEGLIGMGPERYGVMDNVNLGQAKAPSGYVFLGWEYTPGLSPEYTAVYEADVLGGNKPGTGDGIPDRYQTKVSFEILSGTWADGSRKTIEKYVTLKDTYFHWWTDDKNKGVARIPYNQIPTGMKPNKGWKAGSWFYNSEVIEPRDIADMVIKKDSNEVFTYRYVTSFSYEVAFDGNGADSGSMEKEAFSLPEVKALTANEYKKTGYKFAGWDTSSDGKTVVYEDCAIVGCLTEEHGAVITLYAVWEPDTANIEYQPEQTGFDGIPKGETLKTDYDDRIRVIKGDGIWTVPESLYPDETEQDVYIVKGDIDLGIPVPPEGKMFIGWNCELKDIPTFTAIYEEDRVGGKDSVAGKDIGDGIPDKYQINITFSVKNGTWDGQNSADIVVWVTLKDANGCWDMNGTGTCPVVKGMVPDKGYVKSGSWKPDVSGENIEVSRSSARTYTFTFDKKSDAPDTGDYNNMYLWIILMITGTCTIGLAGSVRRKK